MRERQSSSLNNFDSRRLTLTTRNRRLADSNPGFASQIAKMDFRQGSGTKRRIAQTGGIHYLQIPRCRKVKLLKCLASRSEVSLIKCGFEGLQKNFPTVNCSMQGKDFEVALFQCA